eukprot:gene42680-52947_t
MYSAWSQGRLPPDFWKKIADVLLHAKVKTSHLGHTKKVHGLGHAADDHKNSAFDCGGRKVTVAQYYEDMCKDPKNVLYLKALPGGTLRYPKLPLVNVGSETKPCWMPMELLFVREGQSRAKSTTPAMTAEIVKIAAVPPVKRADFITGGETPVISVIAQDKDANGVQRVGFTGSWEPRFQIKTPAPNPSAKGYKCAMLVVDDGNVPPRDFVQLADRAFDELKK